MKYVKVIVKNFLDFLHFIYIVLKTWISS